MPYPKISSALNNCILHTLTPTLKKEIANLAHPDYSNDFKESYALLKTCFAEFYGIHPVEGFGWGQFHQLLQQYNVGDTQIILGPVLRIYLEHNLRRPEMQDNLALMRIVHHDAGEEAETLDDDEFIRIKTEIQSNGRYSSLSPDEAFICVAKSLGLNIIYNQDGQSRNLGREDDAFVPLSTVHIFHEGGIEGAETGGHWELAPDKQFEEPSTPSQLNMYVSLLGNDQSVTSTGIMYIIRQVFLSFRKLVFQEDTTPSLNELAFTAAQIDKFLFNINHVNKECAKKCLGTYITPQALAFIDAFPEPDIQYDAALIALVDANVFENIRYATMKSTGRFYSSQEYRLALTLLTPASVPLIPSSFSDLRTVSRERVLRADEISGLRGVEFIVYHQGLSEALYEVCNQEKITSQLTNAFIGLLLTDENFFQKASIFLQERAKNTCSQEFSVAKQRAVIYQSSKHEPLSAPPLTTDASNSSFESSDDDAYIVPLDSKAVLMVHLMENLKGKLSSWVWMGIGVDEKFAAIDKLIKKAMRPDADLKAIYVELVQVVTTQRSRLGVFFHLSRHNSSNTTTAIALSEQLMKPKYEALKTLFGIQYKTPGRLRVDFELMVENTDYYPFDHSLK